MDHLIKRDRKEELLQYLARMHQIIDLPGYNNAMIVGQHLVELVSDYKVTFIEIENLLREMKSRIYLIGLPLSFFKKEQNIGKELISKLPGKGKHFKYALWVEVNGKEPLLDLIERNGLTDIDPGLEDTGFLCVRNP